MNFKEFHEKKSTSKKEKYRFPEFFFKSILKQCFQEVWAKNHTTVAKNHTFCHFLKITQNAIPRTVFYFIFPGENINFQLENFYIKLFLGLSLEKKITPPKNHTPFVINHTFLQHCPEKKLPISREFFFLFSYMYYKKKNESYRHIVQLHGEESIQHGLWH